MPATLIDAASYAIIEDIILDDADAPAYVTPGYCYTFIDAIMLLLIQLMLIRRYAMPYYAAMIRQTADTAS